MNITEFLNLTLMNVYGDNINNYEAKLNKVSKLLSHVSIYRLLTFTMLCVIYIYLFQLKLVTSILVAYPILAMLCFSVILKYYRKIVYLKKHTSLLKGINESEILREKGNLEYFEDGSKFINQNHPYTSDLDIFGPYSIFQLLNRTTTESGMIRLSEWLSKPAEHREIEERQNAIKELSKKLEWRQDFQASGMHFQNKKSDYYKLLQWVKEPLVLLKYKVVYIVVAIILSVLLLLSIYLFYTNLHASNRGLLLLYAVNMFLVLLVDYIILKKIKPYVEGIVETSQENINILKGYRILINKIETENFKSKKLDDLQSILIKSKYSAFNEINKLCKLLDFSQQRPIKKIPVGGNFLYPLLNSIFLLDVYLIIGIEKWKFKNQTFLKSWSEVVSEFEVLNSIAGFCYSNPSFSFPKIEERHNYIHFESLGHPLIKSTHRVCNHFHSEGQGHVVMITGSNMGGKSTFLRTVGVNIVLSLAGAPCCATKGQVSHLQLYSSMRTQDNLKNGISSFYAELTRIEKMLKLIESSQNVFFLLDEMFKGTNSEDRHRGGFSLIHQVSQLKTSGIIATHDIELAKLSGDKKLVTNYSFNSEIKEHKMIFSYELHPGICNDFNASALMEKSGIRIISDF